MDLGGGPPYYFMSLEIIVHSALKVDSLTYRLVEFPRIVKLASESSPGGFSARVLLTAILGRISANV